MLAAKEVAHLQEQLGWVDVEFARRMSREEGLSGGGVATVEGETVGKVRAKDAIYVIK